MGFCAFSVYIAYPLELPISYRYKGQFVKLTQAY